MPINPTLFLGFGRDCVKQRAAPFEKRRSHLLVAGGYHVNIQSYYAC